MRELALHILDIAENSISAGANRINIIISENTADDLLSITIEDNGKGMDAEMVKKIVDPFTTSRTTRQVGLGIPFFKAAAESCNGSFQVKSTLGVGTKIEAVFQHSHIDRMPLGDIASTLHSLVIGTPHVNWFFKYGFNDASFIFDDQPIKETLDGLSLSEPSVMKFIREMIEEGIQNVYTQVSNLMEI